MSWLDIFRRKHTEPGIVAGYNFGYRIDASAFPVVVYHNTGDPVMDCFDFWDKLPSIGDRHKYRDDMYVTSVDYFYSTAIVTYSQGSRVMLPTMEVVWQPPS